MNIDVPPWNFQNIRPFLNDELVGCNQNKELSTITDITNEVMLAKPPVKHLACKANKAHDLKDLKFSSWCS